MTNDDALITVIGGEAGEPPLDEADEAILQRSLYRLLEKRVMYATMGDSTSIRTETAEELLKSIIYALSLYLRVNGLPRRALIGRDIAEVFQDAIACIERETKRARALYIRALDYEPPIPNISYRDTLRGLGEFFRRYDPRLMAHDIPCDIDYQLCLPVSDELVGVSYVLEYLQRLLYEQAFLSRFADERVKRLLYKYCPDPIGLLINLCEPAIANAVGAKLTGLSVRSLDVPSDIAARLLSSLARIDSQNIAEKVDKAAMDVCATLQISDAGLRGYVAEAARSICPRLTAAVEGGNLSHVFMAL